MTSSHWRDRDRTTDNGNVPSPGDSPAPTPSDPAAASGGAWALPLLAFGLGLIACCLVIPATDDNRGLVFERERLRDELAGLERQVAVNDDFLNRIHGDLELAGRLAERQLRPSEPGVSTLSPTPAGRPGGGNFAMSPFALIRAEPEPYVLVPVPPAGGKLAAYCRRPRTRLAVLGGGLFCCMIGLLGGGGATTPRKT